MSLVYEELKKDEMSKEEHAARRRAEEARQREQSTSWGSAPGDMKEQKEQAAKKDPDWYKHLQDICEEKARRDKMPWGHDYCPYCMPPRCPHCGRPMPGLSPRRYYY